MYAPGEGAASLVNLKWEKNLSGCRIWYGNCLYSERRGISDEEFSQIKINILHEHWTYAWGGSTNGPTPFYLQNMF